MTDAHEPSDRPKMLIADDDPAIVKLLAERCSNLGFEVDTASNGVQALIKASRSHPDIMIIDINMPEADGLTVRGLGYHGAASGSVLRTTAMPSNVAYWG